MERDGLIHRSVDPGDRRRAHVHLTERARELERPLAQTARDINAAATRNLRPEERQALMRTLAQLIDALESHAAR